MVVENPLERYAKSTKAEQALGAPKSGKDVNAWRKKHPTLVKRAAKAAREGKSPVLTPQEVARRDVADRKAGVAAEKAGPAWLPGEDVGALRRNSASQFRRDRGSAATNPTGEELWYFGKGESPTIPTGHKDNVGWAGVTTTRGETLGLIDSRARVLKNINVGELDSPTFDARYPKGVLTDRQLINFVYHLKGDELIGWQKRLFAAGFYPGDAYQEGGIGPNLGQENDAGTIFAWKDAIKAWQRNPSVSISAMIEDRIPRYADRIAKAVAGGGEDPFVAQLADPAALRATANDAGQSILGREFTAEEKERFIKYIQGRQTTQQRKGYDAGNAAGGSMEGTSPEAQALEFAREIAPEEAAAYDRTKTANTFYGLLTRKAPETAAI